MNILQIHPLAESIAQVRYTLIRRKAEALRLLPLLEVEVEILLLE